MSAPQSLTQRHERRDTEYLVQWRFDYFTKWEPSCERECFDRQAALDLVKTLRQVANVTQVAAFKRTTTVEAIS